MYFDPLWIALMVVSTVLGLATQGYIKSTFRKWSQFPVASGMTGADVARRVLDSNGLHDVQIGAVGGALTDHYDPRTRRIALSESVYSSGSIAAAGVAAHEAGHAIQHARGFVWGSVRTALVPVVNIGSNLAFPLIFISVFLNFPALAWVGVLLYSGAVLFQVVTLPVELDASRRAVAALQVSGAVSPDQVPAARQVLNAAALTYVAAALIAVLQLLYFIGLARRD